MTDLFDVIKNRKSIRRFRQTPVPDDDLQRILDAGRLAPSASNSQPWRFLVVRERDTLARMADAVRAMVDRMIPFAEDEQLAKRLEAYKSNYYTFFERAPLVIVVLMTEYDAGTDRLLGRMGYSAEAVRRLRPLPGLQSVAAAIENMLLAVHALGYGSCWMTGPLVAQEEFARILGYGADRTAVALLPVGVPDEAPPPRNKKPLGELLGP